MDKTYEGSCFCGAVQFTATGAPEAMGYCHCTSCRTWSAGPLNGFSLWKPEALKVTKGADQIGTFNKTPVSLRKWCKACGGHLLTEHPEWKLVDVFAAASGPDAALRQTVAPDPVSAPDTAHSVIGSEK